MEFSANVGQVPFVQLGNDDAAAFDANLEAVQGGGSAAKPVIRLIQTVEDAWMGKIVEATGAKKEIEGAQRLGNFDELGIVGRTALARGRVGGGAGPQLGGGEVVAKSWSVGGQERIPHATKSLPDVPRPVRLKSEP